MHETLRALPADLRRDLTTRSDRAGLLHLAGHGGAIAVTSALVLAGVPGWPLLLPVQGVLLVFLFTLLHETVHETPFASLRLNRIVGAVAGFVVVVPPLWFRYFHLAHHRHTHDPARDPELAGTRPMTKARYLWHLTGLPTWAANLRTLVANAWRVPGDAWIPGPARRRVTVEARGYLLAYAALLTVALGPALWLWVVPVLLGQPFLRAYLLAEHTRCPHVADMLENTRTTLTGRLVRFVAWNMPYHAEHHVWPTVPFHRLPALHALLRDRLRVTAPGYRAFNASLWADLPPRP